MAGASGDTASALIEALRENPYAFDFFQAARRLECAHPDKPRIGTSPRPSADPVRFRQHPSLAFAPSTIHSVVPGPHSGCPVVSVNFFGLFGPNGPMPLHLTEYVHDRTLNAHDRTLAGFVDMFHHRFISLFYRAWALNQKMVSHDRPGEDRFAAYVGSFFGIGMPSFRNRDRVPDVAKLHFSGHLAAQTRHADGLASLLADYFGMPADVLPFRGEWIPLPADCYCRLGESPATGTLGSTAVCGTRTWQAEHKFRIRLGPMGLRDYERMLPEGASFARLRDWVRNYAGDALAWDAQLVLKREEVPPTKLGAAGRLGWNTWMLSGPADRDRDDLVVRPRYP